MPRIKLDMPDHFEFSTEFSVRIGDVNYGGHMGNDSILSMLNEARIRFLREHGLSEMDAGGAGLIMGDVAIVYKAQAFHGDRLSVEVCVGEVGRHGCELYYRVSHKKSGQETALAKTGILFFDYSSNKLAKTPEKFKRLFDKVRHDAVPGAPKSQDTHSSR